MLILKYRSSMMILRPKLAKFDANGEYLDEEMEFTFDDFTIKQEFELLDGFVVKK